MTRPVLQIANSRGVPGTAGALVRDETGADLLLANYHVVFGEGATSGERVWAIPPDQPKEPRGWAVCLGAAQQGRIGRVTFNGEACFVDCALVELAAGNGFPAWLEEVISGPWPSEIGMAAPGQGVWKHGPTTGVTEGVVVDIAYPDYPVIDNRSWTATGQLLVEPRDPELNFSASGDSGSALCDQHGRMVGLLWGANLSGQGIACPIEPILNCLGVSLAARRRR
jgi:hypothetical protein